jgi:hypothetical protein
MLKYDVTNNLACKPMGTVFFAPDITQIMESLETLFLFDVIQGKYASVICSYHVSD